jgi:hypothetical protein
MRMRSLGAAALFAPEGYPWRCRHCYDLKRCWKSWRLRIFVTARQSDFNASSIPAAKIRPPLDTLSLFDAVPFFGLSLCAAPRWFFCTTTVEQAERSKAKKLRTRLIVSKS